MKWNSFLESNPAVGFDILICNILEKQIHEPYQINYYTCHSSKYMEILGKYNMNLAFTFWCKIEIQEIFDEL